MLATRGDAGGPGDRVGSRDTPAWVAMFTTPRGRGTLTKLHCVNAQKWLKISMVRRLQKYCLPEELKPEFTSLMSDLAVLVRSSHRNPHFPGPWGSPQAYFLTPPRGKTFSPTVASTLFHSIRLNLGIIIFTGGINNLPFVKTLQG